MDQGLVAAFVTHRLKRTFALAGAAAEEDTEKTLSNSGKVTTSVTLSRTLLRLGAMSPRSV